MFDLERGAGFFPEQKLIVFTYLAFPALIEPYS